MKQQRHLKGKSAKGGKVAIVDTKKSNDLQLQEKWAIIAWCMQYYDVEKKRMMDGSYPAAEEHFDGRVKSAAIRKIMSDYLEASEASKFPDMESKKAGVVGTKSQLELHKEKIMDLHNVTEGKLACWRFAKLYEEEFGTRIPTSTMRLYLQDMGATAVRTYVAPILNPKQRLERLEFIMKKIKRSGRAWTFHNDGKIILHSDEKWFYTVQLKTVVRSMPGQKHKVMRQKCQHKSHIPKIMFNSIIGVNKKVYIAPFLKFEKAKRGDYRTGLKKGDEIMSGVNVDAETYLEYWTKEGGGLDQIFKIYGSQAVEVQHDGATPHVGKGNEEALNAAGQLKGRNITFLKQPPNSPDMNWNDLAFFYSLQCDANALKGSTCTLKQLLPIVLKAFKD